MNIYKVKVGCFELFVLGNNLTDVENFCTKEHEGNRIQSVEYIGYCRLPELGKDSK